MAGAASVRGHPMPALRTRARTAERRRRRRLRPALTLAVVRCNIN